MARVRDALGALLRAVPPFRGKARVGAALQGLLGAVAPSSVGVVRTTLRDGSRLQVDLRSPTERATFWTGDYDGAIVRALSKRLPEEAVVLDIGANIGFYSIPLARAGADVYAFEPMPANYDRLLANAAANGVSERVTATCVAVGETEGRLELAPEPGGAETGNAAPASPGARGVVSVLVRPLDALAGELGIDRCHLVKIDVEGGELAVLRGGEGFLTRHRPLIFAELNGYWMREAGWTEEDLLALARSWRYEPTRLDSGNVLLVP